MSAAEEDQDLVDYDEEEEEQNVAAEETADAEGKETKKWVYKKYKKTIPPPCQKATMRWFKEAPPTSGGSPFITSIKPFVCPDCLKIVRLCQVQIPP